MKKRTFSILAALCLCLTLLPTVAMAAEGETEQIAVQASEKITTEEKLQEELDKGGTVTLTQDITITKGLKIACNVTVDLNGHVLRYDETADPDSIFHVAGNHTLTMTDSRPAAKHKDTSLPAGGVITGGKGYRYDGGYGGYHAYYYYGGGVYVESGASFVLAGGTIYACGFQGKAIGQVQGGGIYCEDGSVTIKGGAIRNCVVSGNSGASGGVYIRSWTSEASFTMTGGVIVGCSAMYGGGICASPCAVQITGGSIENCTASKYGGGLSIGGNAGGQVSVLDAVISGCKAENGGGVALIGFAELELQENALITGCTAIENDDAEEGTTGNGAAIYMDLDQPMTVNYPGCFLYANGGRVEDTVYVGTNRYGIINGYYPVKATSAIDHTDGKPTTVFTGNVYCEGDIRGGSFCGSVTVSHDRLGNYAEDKNFWSNLSGGSFHGPVSTKCHVSGGTYYAGLTLEEGAQLSGKPMNTGTELNNETNIPNPEGKPITVIYKSFDSEYAKQIVQTGEKAIEPDTPTRTRYKFVGWYLGESKYNFDNTVTDELTLTAKWEKIHASAPSAPRYDVAVSDGAHGSVTVSPKNAYKGSTVTVTVTPDKGYALETLAVTDKNGSALDLTDKGGGQYTFTMPSGPVTVAATFMDDNTMLNFFVDVPAGAYYYDAVLWAAEGGIVTGTDAVHFSPDASCTREQLVTFLWRAAGSPVVNYAMNFTDVDGGAYYAEAVRWAASLGIVGGYGDGRFGTNDFVTREQVAAMLYRFAKAQGMDITQGGMAAREFDDFESVSPYALEAMDWAVNAGVLKGDNNRLLPQDNCTRAQIVTMLYRALGEK